MLPTYFLNSVLERHLSIDTYFSTSVLVQLITRLLDLCFPENTSKRYSSQDELQSAFELLASELQKQLLPLKKELNENPVIITQKFIEKIPSVYQNLVTDIDSALEIDPASRNSREVIRVYPGFYATSFYRFAHELEQLKVPLIPRILTEYAHSKTGIDIHPAAKIGHHFFIDHGTGVVIGETSIIGNYVKIYQGVTLGALVVRKDLALTKRHPSIEDHVTIYANATILGGDTIIGHHSIIGGNVWLTKSVEPHSTIYHKE